MPSSVTYKRGDEMRRMKMKSNQDNKIEEKSQTSRAESKDMRTHNFKESHGARK
jgi:hypothetical protein